MWYREVPHDRPFRGVCQRSGAGREVEVRGSGSGGAGRPVNPAELVSVFLNSWTDNKAPDNQNNDLRAVLMFLNSGLARKCSEIVD